MKNPGKLDQLVTLKSPTVSKNAAGDAIETFSTIGTRWAAVSDGSGEESVDSAQRTAKEQVGFRIRFDSLTSTLTRQHVVEWGGLAYDITNIVRVPSGRPEFLDLSTERNVP